MFEAFASEPRPSTLDRPPAPAASTLELRPATLSLVSCFLLRVFCFLCRAPLSLLWLVSCLLSRVYCLVSRAPCLVPPAPSLLPCISCPWSLASWPCGPKALKLSLPNHVPRPPIGRLRRTLRRSTFDLRHCLLSLASSFVYLISCASSRVSSLLSLMS